MNCAVRKTTCSSKPPGIAESPSRKAEAVVLKTADIGLHEHVSNKLAEWEVLPFTPPMSLAMLKAAKEQVRQLLFLNPPLVVKHRRSWRCVGNLRSFFLARAILADEDEILCIEIEGTDDVIERHLLLELVMQPALLGARREDIAILAEIAARAEGKGLALPKGRHRDARSYVASLYRLERRQLKVRLERTNPAEESPREAESTS